MSLAKEMVNKLSISGESVMKGEILHSDDICSKENSGQKSYWGIAQVRCNTIIWKRSSCGQCCKDRA